MFYYYLGHFSHFDLQQQIPLLTVPFLATLCFYALLQFVLFIYLFSHLADAFIQSDLQMRTL